MEVDDEDARELREQQSQHLAPERDQMRALVSVMARQRRPPEQPNNIRIYRNPHWRPQPPELTPETLDWLKKNVGRGWATSDAYLSFLRLYDQKEMENHDNLESVPRGLRIWKKSPWKARVGVGPYNKSDRYPWLLHRFIPYGYQDGGLRDPTYQIYLKFDEKVARSQFNCGWLPEQERTQQVIYFSYYCPNLFCRPK